jgi:hypothetical protein
MMHITKCRYINSVCPVYQPNITSKLGLCCRQDRVPLGWFSGLVWTEAQPPIFFCSLPLRPPATLRRPTSPLHTLTPINTMSAAPPEIITSVAASERVCVRRELGVEEMASNIHDSFLFFFPPAATAKKAFFPLLLSRVSGCPSSPSTTTTDYYDSLPIMSCPLRTLHSRSPGPGPPCRFKAPRGP